jgi:hypothetical protein
MLYRQQRTYLGLLGQWTSSSVPSVQGVASEVKDEQGGSPNYLGAQHEPSDQLQKRLCNTFHDTQPLMNNMQIWP